MSDVRCQMSDEVRAGSRPPASVIKDLFLAGDFLLRNRRATRSFAGAGVGVRALSAHGQALAMAKPAVAANVHQPFDVQLDRLPQITLDVALCVDDRANAIQLFFIQVTDLLVNINMRFVENARRARSA